MKSHDLRFAPLCVLLAACLMLAGTAAWAQNAAVSGRVTDTSEGLIPNVTVELTNRGTQIKSSTVSVASRTSRRAQSVFRFRRGRWTRPSRLAVASASETACRWGLERGMMRSFLIRPRAGAKRSL